MKHIGLTEIDARSVLVRASRTVMEINLDYFVKEEKIIQDYIDKRANRFFFPKQLTKKQAIKALDEESFCGLWRPYIDSSYHRLLDIIGLCSESIDNGNGKIWLNQKMVRVLPRK